MRKMIHAIFGVLKNNSKFNKKNALQTPLTSLKKHRIKQPSFTEFFASHRPAG
jgi:hypothetical protein